MADHWETPFDRGMMCGTCVHWSRTGGGDLGKCGAISTHNDDGDELAFLTGPPHPLGTDEVSLLTLRHFSCSYWNGPRAVAHAAPALP